MKHLLMIIFFLPGLLSGKTVLSGRFDSVLVPPGGVVRFRVALIHDKSGSLVSLSTNRYHEDIEFGMDSPVVRDTADGNKITEIAGQLQVFAISNFQFAGLKVVFREHGRKHVRILGRSTITVATPPVNFKKKPLILPAKGPLGYPRSMTLVLVLGATILIAGAIAYWLYRNRKKNQPAVIPGMDKRIDPWELALRRFDFLREHFPESEQEIKDYYFELTETVRIYLHSRTELHFEETTTSELLNLLEHVPWIHQNEAETLVSLFQDADMVKFARFRPEEESIRSFFSGIESWMLISNGEYMRYTAIRQGGAR